MKSTDVLIIGGGVAGTTAAEVFRSKDPGSRVLLVSEEKHRLYSRVLLPHAIQEKISSERVFLKEQDFYSKNNIEFISNTSVVDLDPQKKVVELDSGEKIKFEKAVITTGGRPVEWEVKGADLPGVMRLQTFEDIKEISQRAKQGGVMVIVGTGFIALEFAAIADRFGIKAVMLNRGKHLCSSVMGEQLGGAVSAILGEGGVEVLNEVTTSEVLGEQKVEGIRLSSGDEISCSMVGVGIGLTHDTEPFQKIGTSKGILANTYLETDTPGIWTAGDCAEFEDELLGMRHIVGNWTNAIAQGRHVGLALAGERNKFSLLTAYTSSCFPGIGLIFLGEAKLGDGFERLEKVIEPGKKVIELRTFNKRVVGAILLNTPKHRARIAEAISSKTEIETVDEIME